MSASYVQVAPDSTGKKMQTFENTISAQSVEAEAVVLVDSSGVALGAERTCASSVVSASGSVTAGKKSVRLIPSSDFSGTLLGAAWPGGTATVEFSVEGQDTLGAIVYTRAAGTLTIITVT